MTRPQDTSNWSADAFKPSAIHSRLGVGMVLLFIGYAAYVCVAKTAGLTWPYDPDHFRDIAASETVLEHGLGLDPYYKDERWWYNPALPTLIAGIARISGADVPMLYARLGAYLNVLAPIAFYALVRSTSGHVVAAAAVLAYIYATPRGTQAWHTATYSPWLFAATFAQPLFYSTLLAISAMWRRTTGWSLVVVGIGLGLTFLTHTAPAVLLGLVLALGGLVRVEPGIGGPSRVRTAALEVGIPAAVAIIVALPFLVPIALEYQFRVQNWYPLEWTYELLELNRIRDLAYTHATPATALALVGLWRITRSSQAEPDRRILAYWFLANAGLLALGYVRQLSPELKALVPAVVPEFHFLSYFRALLAVLAGWGLLATAEGLHWALRRTITEQRVPTVSAVGLCLLAAAALGAMPRLSKRDDLGSPVTTAGARAEQTSLVAGYQWIKANTPRGAVVLAPDDIAQSVVGPAGRRVVAVDRYFSNPYVRYEPRRADRDEMLRLLASSDQVGFCRLAKDYGVSLIAAGPAEQPSVRRLPWLQPSFVTPEVTIARVSCP